MFTVNSSQGIYHFKEQTKRTVSSEFALLRSQTACRNKTPTTHPLYVTLEISSRCNFFCPMCRRTSVDEHGEDMSLRVFQEVERGLCDMGLPVSINYYNAGEPLMNPNLSVMVSALRVKKKTISTNGYLPFSWLASSSMSRVTISIDGHCRESYRAFRGDHYGVVVNRTMDYLQAKMDHQKKEQTTIIQMLDFPGLAGEKEDFIRFWLNAPGVDAVHIKKLEDQKDGVVRSTCRLPFVHLCVFANGDVGPCHTDIEKEMVVGNVLEFPLKNLWSCRELYNIQQGRATCSKCRCPYEE